MSLDVIACCFRGADSSTQPEHSNRLQKTLSGWLQAAIRAPGINLFRPWLSLILYLIRCPSSPLIIIITLTAVPAYLLNTRPSKSHRIRILMQP